MCSSEGRLFRAIIEGAELTVCENCSKFGDILKEIKVQEPVKVKGKTIISDDKEPETEVMDLLVEDCAEKIRKKRESLGLKQKDFAKRINEKESVVQKIESGHFEPSIDLARKIGSFLKIRLVEEYKEVHEKQAQTKSESFTIGDIIKTKDK